MSRGLLDQQSTTESAVDTLTTSVQTPTFIHLSTTSATLKHLPKGARAQASILLARLIREILNDAGKIQSWQRLLGFASVCFASPKRGGRARNLTTAVIQQMQKYETGVLSNGTTVQAKRIFKKRC